MADLIELDEFTAGVFQIEEDTVWLGGATGPANNQGKALANRTTWLKAQLLALTAETQPLDSDLTAIAALVSAANKLPYATGAGAWALADLTAFARSLLDDADAAAARATLGAASPADIAAAIAALVNSSPATLDTLNELAAALGDDANFAATMTTALALKAPLASPALTGVPTAPTAAPGTNTTQLATTAFVSAMITGGDFKDSVRVASTANIAALTGLLTIDGVVLIAGDRVLVKDQVTGADNGIYIAAAGAWARATDADTGAELSAGATIPVEAGTANADTLWSLTNDGTITIGTTALTFARKDSLAFRQIQPITASVASNALTLTLNPTVLDFRASALNSGVVNTRTVAAPISVVVSSGSTLGTAAATAARLAILAIDNAGTVEVAVVNLAGGNALDETTLISTTAEGGAGAADSASVIYSAVARASVPFRVVGFVDITEAAPGTWATAPSTIQGIGGQALAAFSSLGYGQTVQNVTGSRALSTTYYNTTGRPIFINVSVTTATSPTAVGFVVNGVMAYGSTNGSGGAGSPSYVCGIVPPGGSYSAVLSAGTIQSWIETR